MARKRGAPCLGQHRVPKPVTRLQPVTREDCGPAQGLPASKVGTFTQALYDQAKQQGWIVVSMKDDWKKVFAFD